jgi:membrane-associated HD superfamily phosphohydrolase
MKKIPNDHTMTQITLTVAVPNYLCDEHDTDERAQSAATDRIIASIENYCDAVVLGWESTALTLTAGKS